MGKNSSTVQPEQGCLRDSEKIVVMAMTVDPDESIDEEVTH